MFEGIWRTSVKIGCALVIAGSFGALGAVGCEAGGVGDPCIPEDEFRENFSGFNLSEENIESRSFQCQTRICLVNHFQGRVSCGSGQTAPESCSETDPCSKQGESCVTGGVVLTSCDPVACSDSGADPRNCSNADGTNLACGGGICNSTGRFCQCVAGQCPEGYVCRNGEGQSNLCETSVCAPDANGDKIITSDERDPERCYIPGTNDPVAVPVCGWCEKRTPEQAVYCSCRCGPPDTGATEADENFNFCDCPEGFTCDEVRKNVGLGDAQIAGKYCVREGTQYTDEATDCGEVQGFWAPQCNGLPAAGGS